MKTLTIVIPILYLNRYAEEAMRHLAKQRTGDGIEINLVCGNAQSLESVKSIFHDSSLNWRTTLIATTSSNRLRQEARNSTTDFVFYHDADDYADLAAIEEEMQRDPDMSQVHCYPILRKIISEQGEVTQVVTVYDHGDGPLTDIRRVPTYVYSKLIPSKALQYAQFPNLPYSQDWAISYPLYAHIAHWSHSKPLYTYMNYPASSSAVRHTRLYSTMRVDSYSRQLCSMFNGFDHHFLRFRYLTLLNVRYKKCGKRYFDKGINIFRLLTHSPFSRFTASIFYQYPKIIARLITAK